MLIGHLGVFLMLIGHLGVFLPEIPVQITCLFPYWTVSLWIVSC